MDFTALQVGLATGTNNHLRKTNQAVLVYLRDQQLQVKRYKYASPSLERRSNALPTYRGQSKAFSITVLTAV